MNSKYPLPFNDDVNRRQFVSTVTRAVGSAICIATPVISQSKQNTQDNQSWTVGQIMDLFIGEVPGAPFAQTVDTLKSGNRDIKVTGIVTTMFATVEVIQKAITLNANFIIAHEPTFYNHLDDTSWLASDPVYRYKADLLKKHKIAVWRNHDYIHRLVADGVRAGVVAQLGWEQYSTTDNGAVFEMPSITLMSLMAQVKGKLGIPTVRYIGNPSETGTKVLLMPGARGVETRSRPSVAKSPTSFYAAKFQSGKRPST